MNDEIIIAKLKYWIPLFYGKENAQYAFSKKKGDYFYFGYENGDDFVTNKVTKPVAIFLTIGYTSFHNFLVKENFDTTTLQPVKRVRTK
jgi:hypothetical protein